MIGMVPSAGISVTVLLLLAAVLGASTLTYVALVRRATTDRRRVELQEWAREAGLRFMHCEPHQLPAPLDHLATHHPQARTCLGDGQTTLVELATRRLPNGASGAPTDFTWHLLVRTIAVPWRPTGLRPAGERASFLDLFSLSSFPRLRSGERFVVFGTDSADARVLANSMIPSLLPPDVGLLLHGTTIVLDFSDRPFDTLEFGRIMALGEQIVQRLPSPS